MSVSVVVPSVGESITEVIIARWLKPVGAFVEADEPVVAIDTDKVSTDVPAPASGVLVAIAKADGATAAVGEAIATIDTTAARPAAASVQQSAPPVSAPMAPATVQAAPAPAPVAAPPAPLVMPAAARVLGEAGLPATSATGTGKDGRVLKEDAERALAASRAVASAPAPAAGAAPSPAASVAVSAPVGSRHEEVVPMTSLRKRIAERLVQSQQTTATLTTFNEVDMTAILELRKRHQEAFVAKYGVKLGMMSFFVKAAVDALRLVPEINAEVRGDSLIYKSYCDIGVAVGGGKGLVVPVLRNAERLSFAEIELQIADFGRRAKDNKLSLDDLSGGTFTVSNGGVYGSMMSTPILNPPQSGILGMHNVIERPIGLHGQVVLRPMMYIALSYDHRVVDGRGSVTFLKRIKECCEAPERMLLEI